MAIKKTKVESPKPRVSAKQRFEAYKTLAVNALYKVLNPSNRRAAAITSHEMVNGILKPNAINITELISMSQTAAALGHYIRLSAEGEGPKAQLIITFVSPSYFELTSMPASASVFYSRRFFEKFLEAAGEDALTLRGTLRTPIDPEVEELVREAGTLAGLEFRFRVLGGY